jgi:hypothetical protein
MAPNEGIASDFVVLEGDKVIGRIMLHPQAPEGRPWFWTITADVGRTPLADDRGSATCEQAMAEFKAQWSL